MTTPAERPLPAPPGLVDAAAAMRRGDLSAGELLHACQSRRDEALGAYVTWTPQLAVAQANAADAAFQAGSDLGHLQGIPVSIKDLFGVSGIPIYAGSPRELPVPWRSEGLLMRRLRRQLGVIIGKTHMVEFAFGGLGTNAHWGAPRNPHGPDRLPGGSSSGAGVSVAEGSALLAFATDTSGSARVPAAMTGTVGLKVTRDRLPLDGAVPLSDSLDSFGLIARDARDMAHAFTALDARRSDSHAAPAPARAFTLGIPERFFWTDGSAGVNEAVERVRAAMAKAGARMLPLELPHSEEAFDLFRAGGLAAPELDRFLADELPAWRETLDPGVRARVDAVSGLTAREYLQRVALLQRWSTAAARALTDVDALITPTVAITPPRPEDVASVEAYRRTNLLALRNTVVANLLGLCALTLPAGRDAAGMPVGLQLIAAPQREAELLAIAQAIEPLTPWRQEKP
ncbi:MAG: amidase [Halofilum sp. (in: g-proteobacteria)]